MDVADTVISGVYLHRPSPEYCLAFDRMMQCNNDSDQPSLAVLSSEVHAVELLKRIPAPLHLAGTGAFDPVSFVEAAAGWNWGPIEAVNLAVKGVKYASMLWAEPEAATAARVASQLHRQAASSTDLWVITSAPLRRFLPAWQSQPHPANHPLHPGSTRQVLRKAGWQMQEQIVLHGPRSIAWTFLARAFEKLGRHDWRDRCILTMRTHYQEPGWAWPLASLALIHARPL